MNNRPICFDFDGVIIDSEPAHFAAFQSTLKSHGYDLTPEQYIEHFAGKTDHQGFVDYFGWLGCVEDIDKLLKKKSTQYASIAPGTATLYPAISGLLKSLAAVNPLAIVTGSQRTEVDTILSLHELTSCFNVIVSADDIHHGKPNPEGYLLAANQLGYAAEHCIAVEDSPSGVAAAKAAGMYCIAVTTTHSKNQLHNADITKDKLRLTDFQ